MKYISKKKVAFWLSILLLAGACSPKTSGNFAGNFNGNSELAKNLYLMEGLKFDVLGDKNNASALLFNALKADPTCDACYYKLAEIHLHAGLIPQAVHGSSCAGQLESTNIG
jgi:Tfp pilus assembly protein PilF